MSTKAKLLLAVMALAFGGLACGVSGETTPEPLFPTPDLTMTAIYAVLYVTPDTPTALPLPPSNTPAPPLPTVALTPTDWLYPSPNPTMLAPTLTTVAQTATQVATLGPTNTPTRTPTTIPSSRPSGNLIATYLSVSPTLDGNLVEWNLTRYKVTSVVYGRDRWDGADDLSAEAMFGWDEKNLYIGVYVTDEEYVQNASGEDLFLGDSLEVLIDTNLTGDYFTTGLSPDDFQLGISPGSPQPGDNPEAYLWFPQSIAGGRNYVTSGQRLHGGDWEMEVAIPWSVFEITPQSGARYGFAFSVSDNDVTGGQKQQTMISMVSTRLLTNPTTWGDLVLYRP
ncbi:MAG: hypothetical protein JW726_16105 [Anaerolineales bacterium]|nr:hypothetical protein [Anaerolineales bacterium]